VNGTINLLRACFEGETVHRRRRMIVARTPGENSATNVYAASKAHPGNSARCLLGLKAGRLSAQRFFRPMVRANPLRR
jgi:hypothetical protein